jgi:hypothetical protein
MHALRAALGMSALVVQAPGVDEGGPPTQLLALVKSLQ